MQIGESQETTDIALSEQPMNSMDVPNFNNSDVSTDNSEQSSAIHPTSTEENFKKGLVDWYNEFNVPLNAFGKLLKILKPTHHYLPLDPRTLLNTKSSTIEMNDNGEFAYFGLEENILKYASLYDKSITIVKLDINIDGIPVFKSRGTSFWPILCSIDNSFDYEYNSIHPFIVAIFYGRSKPEINHYLSKFINELKSLMANGIEIDGQVKKFEIRSIIADAPAKSYLKQTIGHTGFSSCDRCHIKGVSKNGSRSFEEDNCIKRTNVEFRERSDPAHHTGDSPFEELQIDMIDVFVYDYMHLILLGIVKKILNLHLKVRPFKISGIQMTIIENRIRKLKEYVPCDFGRKPRSFTEFERFKASEFRLLILYTGIVIFQDIFTDEYYHLFLTLMFITRILCDKTHVEDSDMLNYAENLCKSFVNQFKRKYSSVNVSYNVHALIHVVDDVRRLGVLDSFSSFPYESGLGNIKRKIRSSNNPVAQISRRISEGYSIPKKKVVQMDEYFINDLKIIFGKLKDSCVMLMNKSFVRIESVKQDVAFCKELKIIKASSNHPFNLSLLDIYVVKLSENQVLVKKRDIACKCIILPYKNNFLISKIL